MKRLITEWRQFLREDNNKKRVPMVDQDNIDDKPDPWEDDAEEEEEESLDEESKKDPGKVDLYLPPGEEMILKADQEGHNRGLVVKLTNEGGYDVHYWYGSPDKVVPAELRADGKKVGDDIKRVYLGFHPELKDEE